MRPSSPIAETRRVPPAASMDEGLRDRLARYAGTPAGLAALVLLLVVATGIGSTVATYRSLRRAGEAHSEASLRQQAASVEAALAQAFAVADPLLDRLSVVIGDPGGSAAVEPLLLTMAELAAARRGLSWVSVSYPDGRFVGVEVEHGVPKGVVSTVTPPVERTYVLGPTGAFVRSGEAASTYDPRGRTFYRDAVARGGRVWTDPYPFLPDLRTGITRAAPVRGADGALMAVLTVDFDTGELSDVLGRVGVGERFVVTMDDAVLAAAGAPEPSRERRDPSRPLSLGDFSDEVVRALARGDGGRELRVGSETYWRRRLPIARLGSHPIVLHAVVPESKLFARARAEATSGALRTTLLSLVALGFGILLSQRIAKLRRTRDQAVAAAARARAEVEELGAYTLLEPIGKGGMGEVYRARHTLLARDAALKLVETTPGRTDEVGRKRFFEEARLLSSMRCIHTVAVYDFGIASDGRYFLAMELLEGLDLDALVRRHGPQPGARVASILAQTCHSLAEAHAAGLVHQDVKPGNVFLCRLADSLDVVKVLDFGLTRAVGRRRSDGLAEGTPAFMAPEQARGEAVTPATDLYAVGCVGFFLLTGRFPYDGTTSEEYMRAHVASPVPELPRLLRDALPAAFVQLLVRCLAKDPQERPVSASVLASALEGFEFTGGARFDADERETFWRMHDSSRTAADSAAATTVRDVEPAATRMVRRSAPD